MMDVVKNIGDWGEKQIREFDELSKHKILEALRQIG